jgi:photosystem II stability/assembly factor-like uncharacterized protein
MLMISNQAVCFSFLNVGIIAIALWIGDGSQKELARQTAVQNLSPTRSAEALKSSTPSLYRTSTPPVTRAYTRELKPSRIRQNTRTPTITGTRPATSTPSLTPTITAVSSEQTQLNYVSFINPQEGWLTFGDDLLESKDGGLTWQKIATLRGIEEIDFVSADIGWARSKNRLYRSTDSGRSWQKITEFPERIREIDFLDENYGWIANSQALIYTEDGGLTLHQAIDACGAPNEPNGRISVTAYGHIWQSCPIVEMGIRPNTLYHSANNGNDWQTIADYDPSKRRSQLTINAYLYELSMLNAKQGWFFCFDRSYLDGKYPSMFFKTTDGGKSWALQDPIAEGRLQSLNMLSAKIGFVISKQERISQLLKTEDGGLTWKVIYQK